MLDARLMRENPDVIRESLKKRGASFDLDKLIGLDVKRRELIKEVETKKNQRNVTSDEIARSRKSGIDAKERIEELRGLGKEIEALERELRAIEAEWETMSLEIPNIPHESVPV